MNRARGVLIIGDVFGQQIESATFTCLHCGMPRARSKVEAKWCSNCDAEVCLSAECVECIPWRRKMADMEARQRFVCDALR